MSYVDLSLQVLEEFAEAGVWRGDVAAVLLDQGEARQPVESLRRAYRARQKVAGCCRSCPKPAAVNAKGKRLAYCEGHRAQANARARKALQ